jgi:hypothetical protein
LIVESGCCVHISRGIYITLKEPELYID